MKKHSLLYLTLLLLVSILSWGCDDFQTAPGTEEGVIVEKKLEQKEGGGLCICIDENEQPEVFFKKIEEKLEKWRNKDKK